MQTKKELPAVEIPQSPNYHKNYDGVSGDGDPCAICGREVKRAKTAHYIRMGRGGSHAVTNEEADANLGEDLGCQPIGPDCWRKYPELHCLEDGEYRERTLTKIQMARVIVQALLNLDKEPREDVTSWVATRLIRQEARHKKDFVESRYELAVKVLEKKVVNA